MTDLGLALDFLTGQPAEGLVRIFWFTISFEIPRYACAFLALFIALLTAERRLKNIAPIPLAIRPTVSVTVVGHNEAASLERCLRSLREQTFIPTEVVVVSDGSSDDMAAVATRLLGQGLAHHALATDLRAGKSAGFNLAFKVCRGDIVVNVDCDCSYDRFALESIIAPFADPGIGAVSGDIAPRNGATGFIARMQEIEYMLSISVSRRIAAGLGQVSCVSGAFGAFRRTALEQIGGCDVGGGEDLDVTLRMRSAGWRVTFASDATCYTDVPANLWALTRQRLRWERDAIRLRLRKHREIVFASSPRRRFINAVHQWDFLIFELGASAIFPFYLVLMFSLYGSLAVPILMAAQFGLLFIDAAILALAALIVPRTGKLSCLLYIPGFSIYSGWIMRPVRLLAFAQEWFLFGSRRDNYVPAKVRLIRKW
jgi:cellulose synthase/poly-beta-1,6-N-acetylglucosamine synthase-like glycosyltransferase